MKNDNDMRVDAFNIYTEQLRDGQHEQIDEKFPSNFLDVHEETLSFKDPVRVRGEVYLAADDLILHFTISTNGIIPCTICNEPVNVEIKLQNFYHAEPLTEIKSGVYNFRELIREAILLETPAFAECNQGNCRMRKEYKKYLKDPQPNAEEEGYHPFADL
jgi:uncharacterized metal-binding protein YceD (DUF177 family)